MELRGWLIDTFNDQVPDDEDDEEEHYQKIKFCQACKDIVTVGQRCPDVGCMARVHNYCVAKLFRAQGGKEECPLCKTEWSDPMSVGEKAAKDSIRRTNGSSTTTTLPLRFEPTVRLRTSPRTEKSKQTKALYAGGQGIIASWGMILTMERENMESRQNCLRLIVHQKQRWRQ